MSPLIPGIVLLALLAKKPSAPVPKLATADPAPSPSDAEANQALATADPEEQFDPTQLAKTALISAEAEGEDAEEAEIDAFETYLLNGGRDVISFYKTLTGEDATDPTLERWAGMTRAAIEEELSLETDLDKSGIKEIVDNYMLGSGRSAKVSGSPYRVSGGGKRRWLGKALIMGTIALVVGPMSIGQWVLAGAFSATLRRAKIHDVVNKLAKEAKNSGSNIVILPTDTPQNDPIVKAVVRGLTERGLTVLFTGPARQR